MAVAAMVGCGLWPLEGLGSEMFTGTVLAKIRVDSTATNSWASNKLTQCSGRSTWGILYHQIEPEGKHQGADDETKEDTGMRWRGIRADRGFVGGALHLRAGEGHSLARTYFCGWFKARLHCGGGSTRRQSADSQALLERGSLRGRGHPRSLHGDLPQSHDVNDRGVARETWHLGEHNI